MSKLRVIRADSVPVICAERTNYRYFHCNLRTLQIKVLDPGIQCFARLPDANQLSNSK